MKASPAQPVFRYVVDPDSNAFPPEIGGDHGIYSVQVEDCLPDMQASATGLNQFLDSSSGLAVHCIDPLGNNGTYYVLGSGRTNIYSSTSPKGQQISPAIAGQDCQDAQAAPGAIVGSCVLIQVQLPAIANLLRLDIDLHVVQDPGDTYAPGNYHGCCPGKPALLDPAGEIQLNDGSPAETSGSVTLQPIEVLPAALAQLKVLPYTIVYMPPGNASNASYTTTNTFGTTMTAGDSTSIDNTTRTSKTLDIATDASVNFGLAGADLSTDTHWDHSTSANVGKVQTDTTSDQNSIKTIRTFGPLHNSMLVPGAKGAYANEPFWSDEFVLLQHPQLGIWNLNGASQVQLLGARGSATAPDFAEPSLKDLDECAKAVGAFASGYLLPDGDTLDAQECLALARLDPFYLLGQWIDSGAGGRGLRDGGTDYGMDPAGTGQDEPAGFGQTITWTSTNASASSTSYDASVTDVFGNSYSASAGLTLGSAAVGFKADVKVSAGRSTTSTVGMKISYQNSTATTVASATEITGNFDDHNTGLGYRPHVEVYQDKLFGGYMFQDTTACPPAGCLSGTFTPFQPQASNISIQNAVPAGGVTVKSATVTTANPPALPIPHPTTTHLPPALQTVKP